MKKLIWITTTLLFSILNTYGQGYFATTTSSANRGTNLLHKGIVSFGDQYSSSGLYPLQLYSNSPTKNLAMVIGNATGRWEFAVAGNHGAFAPTATPGTGVIRRLGNHNMIFNMPNDNVIDPDYDTSSYNSFGVTSIKFSDLVNHNSLVIYNTGKVTMGTPKYDTDTNYRLYVKDGIKTERIKIEVAENNGWADYVFEENYSLMPLPELKEFITKNKHLPEVPTTEEAIENGIELKQMNILLLKKVEELTLYLLKQNEKIESITKELDQLRK